MSEQKNVIEFNKLDMEIIPNLDSLPKILGATRKLIRDKSFMKSTSFWPAKFYSISDAGSIRGIPQKLISIYPFSYNPSNRAFKLIKNFSVEVNEMKMIEDKGQLETFALIVGSNFKNSSAVVDYANFKKSMGFKVIKIVVGEGINTPADIRRELKKLLAENNLKYALIMGDSEHVPAYEGRNSSGKTDHYYRAIDTNDYESDINAPDIGVGRITFKDDAQLKSIVNKLIKYQKGIFGDETWLMDASFIATDDKYQVAEGSHNYAIDTYTANFGYRGIFPEAHMVGGDKLYAITHRASGQQTVSTIKLVKTLINYSGHGSETSWAGPNVSQDNVRSLNHSDATPFVISNACVTGNFYKSESFGETWIRHPQGAILFWGSVVNTLWDEDDILERAMYDSIFRLNYLNFDKITQYSLRQVWNFYNGAGKSKYYWEAYHNFGDASILFRSSNTVDVNISGLTVIPIGTQELAYNITDSNGNALVGARATLTRDGEPIAFAYTDGEGNVTYNITPIADFAELRLNIYGANTKFVSQKLTIISPDSPYLILSDFRANGDTVSSVQAKQNVVLNFKVANVSNISLAGATVSIDSVEGPAVRLSDFVVQVPALAGNATYQYTGNQLGFVVNDGIDGEKITLVMTWKTAGGETATMKRVYRLSKGVLETMSVDFGNITNPEIGGFGPGEAGEVYLTVKNTGSSVIENASLEPQAGSCVSEVSNLITIEKLLPGEVVRIINPVWAKLNTDCAVGSYAAISLNGAYERGISLATSGKFIIGRFGRATHLRDNLSLAIADNATATYSFNLDDAVIISKISLHVKLAHTYLGDLTISLIHPSGKKIVLRQKTGGSDNDLDEVFGEGGTNVAELAQLKGLSSKGLWKVEVNDSGAGDTGTLNFINLDIMGLM